MDGQIDRKMFTVLHHSSHKTKTQFLITFRSYKCNFPHQSQQSELNVSVQNLPQKTVNCLLMFVILWLLHLTQTHCFTPEKTQTYLCNVHTCAPVNHLPLRLSCTSYNQTAGGLTTTVLSPETPVYSMQNFLHSFPPTFPS